MRAMIRTSTTPTRPGCRSASRRPRGKGRRRKPRTGCLIPAILLENENRARIEKKAFWGGVPKRSLRGRRTRRGGSPSESATSMRAEVRRRCTRIRSLSFPSLLRRLRFPRLGLRYPSDWHRRNRRGSRQDLMAKTCVLAKPRAAIASTAGVDMFIGRSLQELISFRRVRRGRITLPLRPRVRLRPASPLFNRMRWRGENESYRSCRSPRKMTPSATNSDDGDHQNLRLTRRLSRLLYPDRGYGSIYGRFFEMPKAAKFRSYRCRQVRACQDNPRLAAGGDSKGKPRPPSL